jgi:hypothetical protein
METLTAPITHLSKDTALEQTRQAIYVNCNTLAHLHSVDTSENLGISYGSRPVLQTNMTADTVAGIKLTYLIYLFTAVGLTPGGSSTLHI